MFCTWDLGKQLRERKVGSFCMKFFTKDVTQWYIFCIEAMQIIIHEFHRFAYWFYNFRMRGRAFEVLWNHVKNHVQKLRGNVLPYGSYVQWFESHLQLNIHWAWGGLLTLWIPSEEFTAYGQTEVDLNGFYFFIFDLFYLFYVSFYSSLFLLATYSMYSLDQLRQVLGCNSICWTSSTCITMILLLLFLISMAVH